MQYYIGLNFLLCLSLRVSKHPISIDPQNFSITGILYSLGTHHVLQNNVSKFNTLAFLERRAIIEYESTKSYTKGLFMEFIHVIMKRYYGIY